MKKLLWKIRESISSSYEIRQQLKQVIKNQKEKNEELFAFNQVQPYLGEKYFPLTGYVLSPLLVQKLLNEISLNGVKNILEFGSGFSSIVVCNFILKHNLDVQFTTVDNDANYLEYVKSHITNASDTRLKFVAAPIETKNEFHGANQWYAISAIGDCLRGKPFDLILVDGPYGKLQKNVRHGFLDACKEVYNERTIFYIDDSHRPDERAIVNYLVENYQMEQWDYGTTTRVFKGNRYKV